MTQVVAQFQQAAFLTPVNGVTADASVVLSNDNTVRAKHNAHDADPSIHIQSSLLSARPAAGTQYRFWLTTDGKRAYLDNGVSWDELAYVPSVGGTMTGPIVTFASAVGAAGFNIPHGVAPGAPVNGDMWTTTAGAFIRINGVTKTFTLT